MLKGQLVFPVLVPVSKTLKQRYLVDPDPAVVQEWKVYFFAKRQKLKDYAKFRCSWSDLYQVMGESEKFKSMLRNCSYVDDLIRKSIPGFLLIDYFGSYRVYILPSHDLVVTPEGKVREFNVKARSVEKRILKEKYKAFDNFSIEASWQKSAHCKDADTRIFFSGSEKDSLQAMQLCENCPVIQQCALFGATDYGIFGGLTASTRKKLLGTQLKALLQSDFTPCGNRGNHV